MNTKFESLIERRNWQNKPRASTHGLTRPPRPGLSKGFPGLIYNAATQTAALGGVRLPQLIQDHQVLVLVTISLDDLHP